MLFITLCVYRSVVRDHLNPCMQEPVLKDRTHYRVSDLCVCTFSHYSPWLYSIHMYVQERGRDYNYIM